MRVRSVILIVDYVEQQRHGLATKILGGLGDGRCAPEGH